MCCGQVVEQRQCAWGQQLLVGPDPHRGRPGHVWELLQDEVQHLRQDGGHVEMPCSEAAWLAYMLYPPCSVSSVIAAGVTLVAPGDSGWPGNDANTSRHEELFSKVAPAAARCWPPES